MTSVMEWHPLFQRLLKLVSVRKMLIKMSNYGAPTDKRTWLYSSHLVGLVGVSSFKFQVSI